MLDLGEHQGEFAPALRERVTAAGLSDVTDDVVGRFGKYYALLRRWNARINLTALPLSEIPPADTLDRLFVESLVAAGWIAKDQAGLWFDFGTGGGSPAIPLKVVCPWLPLTMVESRAKKAAFLREVVREIGLKEAVVDEHRLEELPRHASIGSAGLITIRGVRLDAVVFSVAAHLLRQGGHLMLFGGDAQGERSEGDFRLLATVALPGSGRLQVLERV